MPDCYPLTYLEPLCCFQEDGDSEMCPRGQTQKLKGQTVCSSDTGGRRGGGGLGSSQVTSRDRLQGFLKQEGMEGTRTDIMHYPQIHADNT